MVFEEFKDEEIVLRSVIAQRGPRPPLPTTLPPNTKADSILCSSVAGLSLASSSSSISDEDTPLKFERRQQLPRADSSLNGRDPFTMLPWNVMYQIFTTFELKDRLIASQVCRRWNRLLTDGRFPLGEVSVLNLFEKSIWDLKLSDNIQHGGKVECIHLNEFDSLNAVFIHCSSPRVVKIWYQRLEFLEKTLQKIGQCNLKLNSIDVYPYSHYVGASLIHEFLPNLKHIALRPHSSEYFFRGLNMESFPDFETLESLNIDSFNLVGESKLPQNLRTLEWQCRNEKSLSLFVNRLEPLKKLEFLTIGHANLNSLQFLHFIQAIGYWNMTSLQYLYFKLVKFHVHSIMSYGDFSGRFLHALRVLKLELCYGNIQSVLSLFLKMTGPQLKIISLSLLTDQKEISFKDLFNMSSKFHARNLNIHLSLMEQSESPSIESGLKKNDNMEVLTCPSLFAEMITKFEASFILREHTLNNILGAAYFPALTEIKLIQCGAANDTLLQKIAQNCPVLERLSILSCHECTDTGIQYFVERFHERRSDTLKIIWQRDRSHSPTSFITNFFLRLCNQTSWLLEDLNIRSLRKQFRAKFGEKVVIWAKGKTVVIQDYDFYDQSRVLGVVIPIENEERPGTSNDA